MRVVARIYNSSEETLVPSKPSNELERPVALSPDQLTAIQASLTWAEKWACGAENFRKSQTSPFLVLEPQSDVNKFRQNLRTVVDGGVPLEHALSVPVSPSGETIPQVIVKTESFRHMQALQSLAELKTISYEGFKLGADFLTIYGRGKPRGLCHFERKDEYFSGEMVEGIPDGWCKQHLNDHWFYEGGFIEGLPCGFGKRCFSSDSGKTVNLIERGFWGLEGDDDVKFFRCQSPSFFSRAFDSIINILIWQKDGRR